MASMYCGYCEKKVDGMHQLFTMGGFAQPYGCKSCYDKMKRDELRDSFKQHYKETFPRRSDFEREVFNQSEPKTPRYLALKWWNTISHLAKQLLANSYTDSNSQPRRSRQSLTGREIERIFGGQKLAQPAENQ